MKQKADKNNPRLKLIKNLTAFQKNKLSRFLENVDNIRFDECFSC